MDNIFGVGLPELVLILIIAGIIMGPERIVVGARWLGRTTSQLQNVSRSFFRQLNDEIDGIDQTGELQETVAEMRKLQREMKDLRDEVLGVASVTSDEVRKTLREIEDESVRSIAPPEMLPKRMTNGPSPTNGQAAYPPPSLLPKTSEANGPSPAPPTMLPRRVATSDDPE
jgi:Sec-independent protein translocase protein TatA